MLNGFLNTFLYAFCGIYDNARFPQTFPLSIIFKIDLNYLCHLPVLVHAYTESQKCF